MAAKIVRFPHKTPPVVPLAQFIRLGEQSHKRVSSLFVEGHLAANRVVVDASRLRYLRSQIKQFKEAGVEVVLDTKAAELAAPLKFAGSAKDVPWSQVSGGDLVGMPYYLSGHPSDIYGQIARCAVEYGVDAVLSPGHFLGDKNCDSWLDVDRAGCIQLRAALDREGGRHIAIDYLLIVPHLMLNDATARQNIMNALADLPFDNLWIRASGFGNDSPAQPTVAFISALTKLHNLGRPIITDYLGGLIGEAVMALGAASGFAHGVGESERFDARQWHNPPKERDPEKSGGRAIRISLAAINKSLTVKEYETLLSATGGKRLLLPSSHVAGLRTAADIIAEPKILASREAVSNFNALNDVPNAHRATHFIQHRMESAVERARQIKNLTPKPEIARSKDVDPEKLMTRMSKLHKDMSRQSNSLTELYEKLKDAGTSARAVHRLSSLEERARGGKS
ncbi:MAG: hypothetical protein ABJN75_10330 [Hoeflea sp.]|uniref:hypothetical protein n=1 Tax=Hoeflea sp. TaxID=1940281 RepID=UPI0032981C58